MAIIGALAPLVGGITGMMQASYQAKVADANAEIAQQNADRAVAVAAIDAEDSDFQTKALLGEQEVAQGASGVSLSGKSQILTRTSARKLGRRDSLNIIQAGDVERYNYETQKMNFKAEGKAAKMSGIAGLIGGAMSTMGNIASLGSGASLVGGAQSTASPYKYVPQPLAKPTLLKSYLNPLMRPRTSFGH